MNSNSYQVHIEHSPIRNETEVYIYQRHPDGRATFIEATDVVFHTIEEGTNPKPTLKLPRTIADEVFQAIAETLDEKQIKTDKDAKLQGTVEATRYHLEDLRQMLKLKDKS